MPQVNLMPRAKKTSAKKSPTKSSKAPKKAATGRKLGKLAEFVLAQDAKLSAAEVVKLAKTAGFDITSHRVHNIRWAAKQKGKKAPVKAAPAAKAGKPSKAAPTPKPAAAKAKPGKKITKTEYVLGFPPGTSAGDVVAAGKAKGIKLSTAHVYSIRSGANAKAKKAGKAVTAAKTPAPKVAAKPAFRAVPRTGSLEEAFVALVLDIGLARAAEMLGKLKERVQGLAL
jgi:hypothetical protein